MNAPVLSRDCAKKTVNACTMLEVGVPTATLLAVHPAKPFLVLIGDSAKHEKPVLPGGKIDCRDLQSTSLEAAARICAAREFNEETGGEVGELTLFDSCSDPARDRRVVPVGALRDTLVGDLFRNCSDSLPVLASHGVPDFVFLTKVDPEKLSDSGELKNLRWIDSRRLAFGALAAGHDVYVRKYAAGFH